MIVERIAKGKIVPVIALEDAADAVPLCKALQAGGLEIAEITFRTAAAQDSIRAVAAEFPEFALGAGTVTTLDELEAAKEAGAQFAVAPGLNPKIVTRAQKIGLPFFPGVATPSDVELALELGCTTLKFFPAGAMGGLSMIKALYGPYGHRGVQFFPTGGVTAKNMQEYLAHPAVVAIGGSWIVAKSLVAAKDWAQITALTKEAVAMGAGV